MQAVSSSNLRNLPGRVVVHAFWFTFECDLACFWLDKNLTVTFRLAGSRRSTPPKRATSRIYTNRYQGGAASTYKTWLQGIDPETKGKPVYASYIAAKVHQRCETG
jgi:hypothetical protein